jgi:hypothetical protein
MDDNKKYHCIADHKKEKITADNIVYRVKGIDNGQYKKEYEGEREGNPPDFQNPLCYPSIEPEKDGPTE